MQVQIVRADSSNLEFQALVTLLDTDLAIRDGDDHAFYAQFNKTDKLKHVVLIYHQQQAIACGALREWNSEIMEIKRMFVLPAFRRKGYAQLVVKNLMVWAKELGKKKCILETGKISPKPFSSIKKWDFRSSLIMGPISILRIVFVWKFNCELKLILDF